MEFKFSGKGTSVVVVQQQVQQLGFDTSVECTRRVYNGPLDARGPLENDMALGYLGFGTK